MLRITILLFLFLAIVQAAELNYIMAFKPPVTEKTFQQARADVKAAGGKVTYEFKSALKGILVQLPSQEINAFNAKSYVDFLEPDKSVHIN
ncbi:hypothetical protein MFLAVUS_006919 [Mucor flavus]|uniref:Inhibitor I9 domain-containing protein n=1 Tax=Mucor flavus TaxID=439312 RepID=A0ABP9Z2V2_9FUNG